MNLNIVQKFLFFIIFLILGFVCFPYVIDLYKSTQPTDSNIHAKTELVSIPQKNTKNYTMTIQHLAVPHVMLAKNYDLTLSAQESTLVNGFDNIMCTMVSGTINENQKASCFFQTSSAFFNRAKKYLFFPNDVSCRIHDMYIQGKTVVFDLEKHLLHSQKPMIYQHQNFTTTAKKSIIDLKNKQIHLNNGIRSEFFIMHDKQQKR